MSKNGIVSAEARRNGKQSNGIVTLEDQDGAPSGLGSAIVSSEPRVRYSNGWRQGKPAEDPEKVKRWGFVSARPSEYLVCMRGGTVVGGGQGASVFKLPWDSVAVIPTTVQRLQFVADQVTAEKVGVQVTGLAVYRIADPLLAFRMLNFSFPERASEKLERMLGEMFVGAARRLVANLTLEKCLTQRKEALADELMSEIAPVVSGRGRPEDGTDRGWGVVIDTIEIQDVRVLSRSVFEHLQARYRQDQERRAREAELEKTLAVKQNEAEAQRKIALVQVAADTEIKHEQRAAEERAKLEAIATQERVAAAELAHKRAQAQAQLQHDLELKLKLVEAEQSVQRKKQEAAERAKAEELAARARLAAAEREVEQAQLRAAMEREVEKARLEATAEQARHEAAQARAQQALEQARVETEVSEERRKLRDSEIAIRELELQLRAREEELLLHRARAEREIENSLSPQRVQLAVAERLPEIAKVFQQNFGEIKITAMDGANPFSALTAAVTGVMDIARAAGLGLPPPPGEKA